MQEDSSSLHYLLQAENDLSTALLCSFSLTLFSFGSTGGGVGVWGGRELTQRQECSKQPSLRCRPSEQAEARQWKESPDPTQTASVWLQPVGCAVLLR